MPFVKRRSRRAESKGKGAEMKVDYKDVATLLKFATARGKLYSRSRSGLNARSQRNLSLAMKRARFLALMPFVGR